jgi:predicted TPR repeat methyltransferase
VTPAPSSRQDAEALAARARAAWREGDAEAARRAAEDALRADPSQAVALNVLGGIAFAAGDLHGAETRFRAALDADPALARARFNLGLVSLERGGRAEAEAQLAAALEAGGDADDWLLLGNLRHELGRTADALAAWQAAATADAACLPAWVNAGSALRGAGRFAEAIPLLERAIALAPGNAVIRNELGVALHGEGRLEAAQVQFRAALTLAPGDADAGINLADTLRALGRAGEAGVLLAGLARTHPGEGRVHKALGLLALTAGRLEEAADHYRRAAALLPDDPEVQHLLAAAQGRPVEAAPAGYVRTLFDAFAPRFDHELTHDLGYRTPQELATTLRASLPPGTARLRVADLGCGTGLAGAALGDLAGHLEGADLSPRMLEVAAARGLYARLACEDLVAFLDGGAPARFDVVVAADVFNYVGRLDAAFAAAWRALAPGGRFAFSLEVADGEGQGDCQAELRASGRFAHRPGAIRALALARGFAPLAWQDTVLRHDRGQPVAGQVVVLERP